MRRYDGRGADGGVDEREREGDEEDEEVEAIPRPPDHNANANANDRVHAINPLKPATPEEIVSAAIGESAGAGKSVALRTRDAMYSLLFFHLQQDQRQHRQHQRDEGNRHHHGDGNGGPDAHTPRKSSLTRLPTVRLVPPHLAQFSGSRPERMYAWLYTGASPGLAGTDNSEPKRAQLEGAGSGRSGAGGSGGKRVEFVGPPGKDDLDGRGFSIPDTLLWCSMSVVYVALRWLVRMCMPLCAGLFRAFGCFLRGEPVYLALPRAEHGTVGTREKQRPGRGGGAADAEDGAVRRRNVWVACGLLGVLVLCAGPGGAVRVLLRVVVLMPLSVLKGVVRGIVGG